MDKVEMMEEGDDEVVMDGATPDLEPVAGIGVDQPTVEQLLEENKQLKATLEEQTKALKGMAALKKENRALQRRLRTTEQLFKSKWKGMRMELSGLVEEEGLLVERIDNLKKTQFIGSREVGFKLEEIRGLTKKVNDLKSGKTNKSSPPLKKVEQVNGMQLMGRRAAAEILPEEVWKIIFGSVSDSKDLWNLCNTCELFNSILFPWKTGWMLEQALPHLYQHLRGKRLLKTRLVCKSWKKTMDHFLEDHPSLRPHDPEKNEPRRLDLINPMKDRQLGENYFFYLDNTIHMSEFDDPVLYKRWKEVKILGRRITLNLGGEFLEDDEVFDEDDDIDAEPGKGGSELVKHTFEQMWDKFYEFLNCFGSEIWDVNIFCAPSQLDADKWEQKIGQFLTIDLFGIFPNLRKLSVGYEGLTFEEIINHRLLPPAPKLETFESNRWGGTIADVMLRRYHDQLGCLLSTTGCWDRVNPLTWPNLTELHLYAFNEDENFMDLFNGLRLPQLTKLGLHLGELNDNNAEAFQSLLRAIRRLAARTRLNTLRLEGGLGGFQTGQIPGSSYALGQVKTLEFDHYTTGDSAPSYDFLLTFFPLLENLNVFVRKDFENEPFNCDGRMGLLPRAEWDRVKKPFGEEIVEVNKYMLDGQMYRSNIWELMPLLKVFNFQRDIYTRHEYEAYKDKLMERSGGGF